MNAGTRSGRGRLTEVAYQHLREGILRGQIPAGAVLTEQELASELEISRTPVRHALGLLLKEGLVQVGPRRQLIVRGFTPEHRAEILRIREALERLALDQACSMRSVEDIDYLRLLLMKQRRAANEAREDDFIDLDEQFHLRIAASAGLPILHGLLEQLRGFVRVLRLGSVRRPEHMQHVVAEHEAIVDALEDRDAPRALDALAAHLHTSDYALGPEPVAASSEA